MSHEDREQLFYSRNWKKSGVFRVKYYDIYVNNKSVSIIKLPHYNSTTLWTILGLLTFSIFGAILGYVYGSSRDDKKRKKYRSSWVNEDAEVISEDFIPHVVLDIPREVFSTSVDFKKRKLIIFYQGKKLVIKNFKSALINLKNVL